MRVRMTITIDESTIDELNSFPRNHVKNKSALIEKLLRQWIKREKNRIKAEEKEEEDNE